MFKNYDDRLATINEVCSILCRSRASIYRDIKRGAFPKPKKLNGSSRWRLSDIKSVVENGLDE